MIFHSVKSWRLGALWMYQVSIPVKLIYWVSLRMWIVVLIWSSSLALLIHNHQVNLSQKFLTEQVSGRITEVHLEHKGRGSREYSIGYTYEVNGISYSENAYQSTYPDERPAYHPFETVTVYYDAARPSNSKLLGTRAHYLKSIGYIIGLTISTPVLIFFVWGNIRKLRILRWGIARTATVTSYTTVEGGTHYFGLYSSPKGRQVHMHLSRFFKLKNIQKGVPLLFDKHRPENYLLVKDIPRGVYLEEKAKRWRVKLLRLALLVLINAVVILMITATIL
jgi:hypothetical protein